MSGLRYHQHAERPAARLWLYDDDGTLIDFSDPAYSFTFKIGVPGRSAELTKTAGIAGAAGSGSEPAGVPNVTVTWAAGELNLPARVRYRWQLTATIGGLDRVFEESFEVLAQIL